MKRFISFPLFLVFIFNLAFSQSYKDEVIMTIDGRDITAGEFERVYRKNNNENVLEKQSVKEYLDMFINYKLKVIEAEALGMDTAKAFLKEFNAYRSQLAQPYLTSEELTEAFAKEAYDRMKQEIHASHIMIRLSSDAAPEDTLYAWNKISEIRRRVIQGEEFDKVARATSDDPSAKTNAGDLGWFTAFRMVYPFETAAYTTPVGEISEPVRSAYGYHIIKVHEKRPSHGSRRVAHIFKAAPQSMSAEEKQEVKNLIYALHDSLQAGMRFDMLANKYSDDKSSGTKGGELPWFTSGQMIPVFDSVSFALQKKGDYSNPVKSSYGWHLVKLLDKKTVGSFEEEKENILANMKKGDRGKSRDKAFINKLKTEYNFTFYPDNYSLLLASLDSSVFEGEWTADKAAAHFQLPLFSLEETNIRLKDFAEYLETKFHKRKAVSFETLTASLYETFEEEQVLAYEESLLPEKYPEFNYIIQEYHDGILLFDLTDKMVWKKAVEDTTGLEAYFAQHRQNYQWDERAEICELVLNDGNIKQKKFRKTNLKLLKKSSLTQENLVAAFCPGDTAASCFSLNCKIVEKGENEKADLLKWKKGEYSEYTDDGRFAMRIVKDVIPPTPKELDETRGMVIADYQKHLEDKWIQDLRAKYNIQVNEEVLTKIKDL